jgi:hypothetical protein
MKPLYIFDLDGTLALIEHRRHLVEGSTKDWRGFFAACVDDEPNLPVIRTLQALRSSGAEIWIWSGRSDEVRAQTVEWLCKHGCFGFPTNTLPAWPFGAPERFRMRKAGDYQDDVTLKRGWLAEIEPPEYARLAAVFDDRDKVVAMWRDAGVACFQVAPGEF